MNQNQPSQAGSPQKQPQKRKKPNQGQLNTYVKYSGLAFQMIAIMGLAVWGGRRLDDAMGSRFPAFMIIFALLAFGISLYITIKGLPKN